VKWFFRYLCGTSDYGLCYQGRAQLDRILGIHGFFYVYWSRYLGQRRYISGYVFNLFGGAVSWIRKRQFVVALSTTEVEYMATTDARKRRILVADIVFTYGVGAVSYKDRM